MIEIVDYKAGNLSSVKNALDHLGFESAITADPDRIRKAEKIIFPGVGAAKASMQVLKERGLDEALSESVNAGTPVLGICVGCQIILDHSDEDGGVDCLGLIPGWVSRFGCCPEGKDALNAPRFTVPHMGWNQVHFEKSHPIFEGIESETEFYFVHSYFPQLENPNHVLATTEYAGVQFVSAMARNNLVATQFHLEKSSVPGLKVLSNFCNWKGE